MFNSLILSSRRPLPPRCATSSNVSNIASFSMPRAKMPSNKARMEVFGQPDERFARDPLDIDQDRLETDLNETRRRGHATWRNPAREHLFRLRFAARRHLGAPQSGGLKSFRLETRPLVQI